MISRRALIQSSLVGSGLAALGLGPRAALAATASDTKFVFVFAPGGWDTTRVFADEFANPDVDLEPAGLVVRHSTAPPRPRPTDTPTP